jgi:hypothetical protein
MISFQKSNLEFCALKYEQKLNRAFSLSCGKPQISESFNDFTLNLFRTMRITKELKDSSIQKEKVLRTKYPQLATEFRFDEIFPSM